MNSKKVLPIHQAYLASQIRTLNIWKMSLTFQSAYNLYFFDLKGVILKNPQRYAFIVLLITLLCGGYYLPYYF